jgi:copper chaperone CopZ
MAENSSEFTVRGIESADEAENIENELEALDGVMGADVDPENGDTEVRVDVDVLSEERTEITVREMGYELG